MAARSKHRWLRYSIRTLLVAVTASCVWLGWAMQWVHQRREAVQLRRVLLDGETKAPWPLGLFGERGAATVVVNVHGKSLQAANKLAEQSGPRVAELQSLFPEAEIKLLRSWPYMDVGDFVPVNADRLGPQPIPIRVDDGKAESAP